MTQAPTDDDDAPRVCRWTCSNCRSRANDDWSACCAECGAPAPASSRRVGVKLRGKYYLCTLELRHESMTPHHGVYGNEVSAGTSPAQKLAAEFSERLRCHVFDPEGSKPRLTVRRVPPWRRVGGDAR